MTKFYVILFEICVEVVDNRRNIYTDRYEQQIEIRNLLPGHFLPMFRDTRLTNNFFAFSLNPYLQQQLPLNFKPSIIGTKILLLNTSVIM